MNDSVPQLNIPSVEKAAILLLTIGEDNAAKVLKELGPKEVQSIGSTMAALDDIKPEKIESVFASFVDEISDSTGFGIGSEDYVRTMLNKALGQEKASVIIDRILLGGNTSGLDTFRWMDPRSIADLIRREHPQIQAIVIAYLDSELSASVLAELPEEVRLDVMVRVAKLESIQPSALFELNEIFEKQFSGSSTTQAKRMGGTKVAADIMTSLEGAIEAELMDAIGETDEELAQEIKDLMFVFANLMDVDDRSIQAILRETSTELLVVALKGADEPLRDKIFNNMSKRAAELLKDDLEAAGPTKVSEVETAQKEILAVAQKLADAGEIVLGGGGEEML